MRTMAWWTLLAVAGCSKNLDAVDTDTDTDPDTSAGTDADPDTDPGTDVDTDIDTDPDIDTSGGFDWTDAVATLRNHPVGYPAPCTPSGYQSIQGDTTENGHWIASRLTPETYPFEVDAIQIELWHAPSQEGKCRATTLRPILVFKTATTAPPERPSEAAGAQSYTITPALETNGYFIRKELDSPITLQEGQHLYVMMQMEAVFDGSTCVRSCSDSPKDARNYWSGWHMEPYTNWQDIVNPTSFAPIRQNYLIEAYDL